MANRFKAVIFDMGGVLLRTKDQKSRETLAERFGTTREDLERFIFQSPSSVKAEIGEISDTEHWREVISRYGHEHLAVKDVYAEFFAGDELNHELLNYARKLKPEYKVGLLSNAWTNTRENLNEIYDFIGIFDVSIFSAEVKIRKPDSAIYQLMLNRLDINASQAIFIDDMKENVDGAQSLGLEAIHFKNTQTTIEKIGKLLKNGA